MQQQNNGVHQACAVCKHQRKKCSENCVLAPFFPCEKSQQFQAVHMVFGVSNVSKILKGLRTYEDRVQAVESLVWEAQWRQKDPKLGCYGVFKKVVQELNMFKNRAAVHPAVMYEPPCLMGNWNSSGNIAVDNSEFVENVSVSLGFPMSAPYVVNSVIDSSCLQSSIGYSTQQCYLQDKFCLPNECEDQR